MRGSRHFFGAGGGFWGTFEFHVRDIFGNFTLCNLKKFKFSKVGGRTIDPTPLDPHMADVYRITCFFFLCYHTIRIPRIDNMTYVRTHLRKRKKKKLQYILSSRQHPYQWVFFIICIYYFFKLIILSILYMPLEAFHWRLNICMFNMVVIIVTGMPNR